jgi:hypothetical protein
MKDTDMITTAVGIAGAVATAASPVLNAVQPGTSMHPQDWTQLGAAVLFAILGFFTNKKSNG